MNFLNILLQAPATGAAGGGYTSIIMMVLIFVVMYFLMIRPQQKKQKELNNFRNSLQRGDKVVTIGGIYGTVAEIRDKFVFMEIDNNVKIKVDRNSLVKDFSDVQTK